MDILRFAFTLFIELYLLERKGYLLHMITNGDHIEERGDSTYRLPEDFSSTICK
jgi:hypothetical protein